MKLPSDRAWAIFFCRAVLGLIFFMAGVYKCFVMTPLGHARLAFVGPYADTFFPRLALLTLVLVLPRHEDVLSVDVLLGVPDP